jgi:hypothetical protein
MIESQQPLNDALAFLEDWADAIIELGRSGDQDEVELRREATAWQCAMHAFYHWRAAS